MQFLIIISIVGGVTMKCIVKCILCNDNFEKFFGEGPYKLLLLVKENGSLHRAAEQMNMSYSKALRLIKNAENELKMPLLKRKIGGANGGYSELTENAEELINRYEKFKREVNDIAVQKFKELF